MDRGENVYQDFSDNPQAGSGPASEGKEERAGIEKHFKKF